MVLESFYGRLHIAAILSADFEQRRRDLAQGADAYCIHQACEHVLVVDGGLAQRGQRGRRFICVAALEIVQPGELRLFFLNGVSK